MFDDATNIFIIDKSLYIITTVLNCELDKLRDWFAANLLSLNVKRTNYIILGNRSFGDIQLKINYDSLLRVNETQLLGVIINCKLSWSDHIKLIASKLVKVLVYYIKYDIFLMNYLACNYIDALLNHT